jgi:hypothetical protein
MSVLIGDVQENARVKTAGATTDEVAKHLDAVQLLEPTPDILRSALAATVDHACYWQKPDGEDLVAATPEMKPALQRVAKHLAASPFTAWWSTPAPTREQQSVQWDGAPPRPVLSETRGALRAVRDNELAAERDAREQRPTHPATGQSGEWWSRPSQIVPTSSRSLSDGSPAGLWFVEDRLGWDRAESADVIVPEGVRVFEIGGAADWQHLCARFPLEVTAQKGDDWYRATGRKGRWVIPDWSQVAERYDAVHLQVGAYLAAAGVAIAIGESSKTASVIAGWNPDETYWFTSIGYGDERTRWVLEDNGTSVGWLAG